MALITLNITDTMKERLKLEPNQSKLVNDLLQEHYENKNPDDIRAKLKALDERKKQQIELIEKDKEKYMQRLTLHAEKEQVEKDIESARDKRIRELRANIEKNFMEFAGREPTDAETDEAMKRWDDPKGDFNLLDYIEECDV